MSGFGVQGFDELMRARVLGSEQANSPGVGLSAEDADLLGGRSPLGTGEVGAIGAGEGSGDSTLLGQGAEFGNVLGEALQEVAALGKDAKAKADALSRGEPVELHDLYVAMNKSDVAFSLMLEVRNKLVEAWQMLSRSVM